MENSLLAMKNNTSTTSIPELSETSNKTSHEPTSPVALVVLAILAFTLMDVGFDMAGPMLRAYVLDNSHPEVHPRLLIIATLMSAFGGLTLSVFGAFNIPTALEGAFQMEGMAAMLLVLSVSLSVLVSLTFLCSIITARYLERQLPTSECDSAIANSKHFSKVTEEETASFSISGAAHDNDEITCLLGDRNQSPEYTFDKAGTFRSFRTNQTEEVWNVSKDAYEETPETNNFLTEENDQPVKPISDENCNGFLHTRHSNGKSTTNRQNSLFRRSRESTNTPFHRKPSLCSWKLAILCISTFLTVGTNCTFIIYVPNALTVGVYGGDPGARPGTTGYLNYQRGQRMSSLGSVVMYLTYLLATALNKKIFHLNGERVYFLLSQTAMLLASIAFLVWQREELYLVAMVTFGVFRTCVFTVPFVLANRFVQAEVAHTSGDSPSPASSSHAGHAMSLMGAMLPLSYLTLSSLMGPLMEVTGSVWVPLITSCVTCTSSMAVFSLLFCV